MDVGHRRWAIPEGYIPGSSHGTGREMISHDAICILNASDHDAEVKITIYFSDQEPVGPYRLTVPARRTEHVRVNELEDPAPVPKDTPYASIIDSDVPIVVQYTRLDSRQAENALLSTMAFPCG